MPFALAIIGIVILVSAIRGTSGALFSTFKSDFTGEGNFLYWVIAILAVGSIGYVKKLQPISSAFLALLLIVLFISNKGFFAQFKSGISGAASTSCVSASSSTPVTPGMGAAPSPNMNAPLSAPSQNIPGLTNLGEGLLQMQSLGL